MKTRKGQLVNGWCEVCYRKTEQEYLGKKKYLCLKCRNIVK